MAVEEEAFPRGGGRQLSGLERKRLRQDAEAEARRDFLAEWQNDQIRGKKKVKTVRVFRLPCLQAARDSPVLAASTHLSLSADLLLCNFFSS